MPVEQVKLADFGEGLHEAEILEWHVKVGDQVKVDQTLLEVHTEKVSDDIASPVTGTVLELLVKEGDVVEVGATLCKIEVGSGGSAKPQPKEDKKETKKEKDDSLFTPAVEFKRISKAASKKEKVYNERVLAAPAVRRRAREMGVDLQKVPGSGPAGRISQADLDVFGKGTPRKTERKRPQIVPGGVTRIPLKGTRRTISNAMRKSLDFHAHYTYFEEVDMTALDDLRAQLKPLMAEKGIKVTYVALVMKCLVPALRAYPLLNSSHDEENNQIILHDYYNIGISVDTEDGLMVPVVKNVEQKSIWQVAEEI